METPTTASEQRTQEALRHLADFVREAAAAGVLNADELQDNGLLAAADAALAGADGQWASEPDCPPNGAAAWWWWARQPGDRPQPVQVRFTATGWQVRRANGHQNLLRTVLERGGVWQPVVVPMPPRATAALNGWEGPVA